MKKMYFIQKGNACFIMILLILFLFSDSLVIADQPMSNMVSVIAENETITSDSFIINITCNPGEPIKSFEFDLDFDQTLFSVCSVSEGDFFSGFDTFFNAGTINNESGVVTDVYGLIVGPGTVESTGVLVSITCDVISEGSGDVALSTVGLTNETSYLSVTGVNDTVIIDSSKPEIQVEQLMHSTPFDTDTTIGWVNLSCLVTDDQGIDEVSVQITCPNSTIVERDCLNRNGNAWFFNSSNDNLFTQPGNYSYSFFAVDQTAVSNTSVVYYVKIPANWDVNTDGTCDLLDFIQVSEQYNEINAEHGWIREDVDNNGEVAVLDLVLLSNDYQSIW